MPQTITPYFTVPDADQFIAFAQSVFGAQLIKDDRYPNGRVQHARLQIDDMVIMLNEATDTYPANISQVHLYVSDADATYEKALTAGAKSLMAPNTRPHGDRMAGITDTSGNIWWIATQKG